METEYMETRYPPNLKIVACAPERLADPATMRCLSC